MEQPLDCASPAPNPVYQDFKIDYTSELDEITKLKVTTTALIETTIRTKLTEALRQKRLQIAMVGVPKLPPPPPPILRGSQVPNLTFNVKRDQIRELDELRRRGATHTQPWAEAHAVKMFSRRYTRNVLVTKGHSDASASLAVKMVCERLFDQPSKKKRVLQRLTSEQMREIETTVVRSKHSRRPVSEYLARCDEHREFDSSFFQGVSGAGQSVQWDLNMPAIDFDESSPERVPVARQLSLRKLPLLSDEQLLAEVVATPKRFPPERTPSEVTHQSSTGTIASNAGARSPSITSIPSFEETVTVESDGSSRSTATPVAFRLAHTRSLDAMAHPASSAAEGASEPPRHPHSLPPNIVNDPDFVEYMRRTNMEPVASTYISYKISSMGDKIDEQYTDQLGRALASVLTDTVETKISYDSFHKAAQKLILEGSSTLDRMFMVACFGRRVLEGAPELHSMVKSYTHTVMEEWVSFMENNSDTEITRDCREYDKWDGEEYPDIFNEFPPAILRVESNEPKPKGMLSTKCNSVEALTASNDACESGDQLDCAQKDTYKPMQILNGNAPSVLSLGRFTSTSPNSSIRIVTPRMHKRSRSDCTQRTMVSPQAATVAEPDPVLPSREVKLNTEPLVPARKSSLQYVYDTAMNLSPAIVHTVCGVFAYFANK